MGRSENAYYELSIVILLSLLWGVVILNRVAIAYLFPFIVDEYKIGYTQAAALGSVLSITFALSAWFCGGLSDRFGLRMVLIPGAMLFFVMAMLSGVANNFWQLFSVRGLMGITQGAILPASIAWIAKASTPSRRGLNFGLHVSLSPLIALGLGPILVTQLSKTMAWQTVFVVLPIPIVIVGVILYFYMKEPKPLPVTGERGTATGLEDKPGFFEPLRYRNVKVSSVVAFLVFSYLSVFMTFVMLYLTNEIRLSVQDAGIIISLLGFTGCFGCILLPLLSDQIGRKAVVIPSFYIIGLGFGGFVLAGSDFLILLVLASIVGFIIGGIPPISLAALTTEGVPPRLVGAASGIPITFGEIFGSALMPLLAGRLSDIHGLKAAMFFPVVAPLIAGFAALYYIETAPKIIERRRAEIEAI